MSNRDWHLSKAVPVTIIIVLLTYILGAVYAYANLERDVKENTTGRAEFKRQISEIYTGVQEIREGLISKGVIKPKQTHFLDSTSSFLE